MYKRFLYLDGEAVINALALIRGGEAEQVVRRIRNEKSGTAGVKLAFWAAEIQLGGKRGKAIEDEVVLKQTVHAAVGELLRELDSEMRHFDGPIKIDEIEENDLVDFRTEIHAVSSPRVRRHATGIVGARTSFWQRLKNFGRADRDAEQANALADRFIERGLGSQFISIAGTRERGGQGGVIAMEITQRYTIVDPAALSRQVTVVGQIEGKCVPDTTERVVIQHMNPPTGMSAAIRAITGEDAPLDFHNLVSVAGPDIDFPSELCVAAPCALVRPLCIYK